jgi:hypothetical protein
LFRIGRVAAGVVSAMKQGFHLRVTQYDVLGFRFDRIDLWTDDRFTRRFDATLGLPLWTWLKLWWLLK